MVAEAAERFRPKNRKAVTIRGMEMNAGTEPAPNPGQCGPESTPLPSAIEETTNGLGGGDSSDSSIPEQARADLDLLALRSLGSLGYDSLSAIDRAAWDRFEREHTLLEVAATLGSLIRTGKTLATFVAELEAASQASLPAYPQTETLESPFTPNSTKP